MIAEDDLLGRFELVRRLHGEGNWMVRCPVHADRTPSLHVTRADDRWLLKCMAGCDTLEILGALELSWGDLFADEGLTSAIVATYPYTDARGRLLYEVVRFFPKDFRQRRPDGAGGWIWKLGDTRRVLYRLPRVVEVVKRHGLVWITEGEKDVHTLERQGETATCAPGGVDKWRPDYSRRLVGARTHVAIDKDKAGHEYVRQVCKSLTQFGVPFVVLEPWHGKDVTEHVRAGGRLDELCKVEVDLRGYVSRDELLQRLRGTFHSHDAFESWMRKRLRVLEAEHVQRAQSTLL